MADSNPRYPIENIMRHLSPWAKDKEHAIALWRSLGEFGQLYAEQCYEQEVVLQQKSN